MAETRLYEDRWFVQNTLPFIMAYLSVHDLFNVSNTCQLWDSIANEYFWEKTYISVCYQHIDNVIVKYGSKIRRLLLMEPEDQEAILKEVNFYHVHQRLRTVGCIRYFSESKTENIDQPLSLDKLKSLTHFRFYTARRLSSCHVCEECCQTYNFHWTSLLSLTEIKCLELGFHIPINFGTNVLKHMEKLEILVLYMFGGINDEHLFEGIKNLANLRELTLLQTNINENMAGFLKSLTSLTKLTIMIREENDTNCLLLMKTIVQLKQTLNDFRWVLNNADCFGKNCQNFLNLENSQPLNRSAIQGALSMEFLNTKVKFLTVREYRDTIKKGFKNCIEYNAHSYRTCENTISAHWVVNEYCLDYDSDDS